MEGNEALAAAGSSEGMTRDDRPSPVPAAVLALVIERPSYGYDLWKRFEDRFASLYPVTVARIYQALKRLESQKLVREVPPALKKGQGSRQPKPNYEATPEGIRRHREWIAADFRDHPHRDELMRRLLSTSAQDVEAMQAVVDAYERICFDEMTARRGFAVKAADRRLNRMARLRDALIAENQRLVHQSRLEFIAYARRLLAEVAGEES
jgi:DNA-binding PadR family transcriptional regulator